MSLSIELLRSPKDINECAHFINRRHLFEPNRLRDATLTHGDRTRAHARRLYALLNETGTEAYLARKIETNEILGFISWIGPAVASKSDNDVTASTPGSSKRSEIEVNMEEELFARVEKERDVDIIQAVARDKKAKEKRFFGEQPFCRRTGVATQLVKHFMKTAQARDPANPHPKVGFSSSPSARTLYEKQGFKVVDWFELEVDDVDEQGQPYRHLARWPYMSNYWQGQEEAVEAAAKRIAFDGRKDQDPGGL